MYKTVLQNKVLKNDRIPIDIIDYTLYNIVHQLYSQMYNIHISLKSFIIIKLLYYKTNSPRLPSCAAKVRVFSPLVLIVSLATIFMVCLPFRQTCLSRRIFVCVVSIKLSFVGAHTNCLAIKNYEN